MIHPFPTIAVDDRVRIVNRRSVWYGCIAPVVRVDHACQYITVMHAGEQWAYAMSEVRLVGRDVG